MTVHTRCSIAFCCQATRDEIEDRCRERNALVLAALQSILSFFSCICHGVDAKSTTLFNRSSSQPCGPSIIRLLEVVILIFLTFLSSRDDRSSVIMSTSSSRPSSSSKQTQNCIYDRLRSQVTRIGSAVQGKSSHLFFVFGASVCRSLFVVVSLTLPFRVIWPRRRSIRPSGGSIEMVSFPKALDSLAMLEVKSPWRRSSRVPRSSSKSVLSSFVSNEIHLSFSFKRTNERNTRSS